MKKKERTKSTKDGKKKKNNDLKKKKMKSFHKVGNVGNRNY